jgi:lysozyme
MSIHDVLLEAHKPTPWDGHINEAGLEIIKRYEGWSPKSYRCPAARWTIGWGSTWDIDGNPVTSKHPRINEEQGTALLRREVRHVEKAIGRLITAELTPNMFSSLVSFCYNVGSGNLQRSSLRMKLNRGFYEAAADELPKWRRANGKILKGLVLRRKTERELFLL